METININYTRDATNTIAGTFTIARKEKLVDLPKGTAVYNVRTDGYSYGNLVKDEKGYRAYYGEIENSWKEVDPYILGCVCPTFEAALEALISEQEPEIKFVGKFYKMVVTTTKVMLDLP